MSDYNKDRTEAEELRPLRSVAMTGRGELLLEARQLGRAFAEMADEPLPQPEAEGWAALEEKALRLALRRRWRYHLSELWRGLGAAQLGLCATAVALIFVLGTLGARSLTPNGRGRRVVADRAAQTAQTAQPVGAADAREHLELAASSAPAATTLRCGAQLQVADGSAEIDQAAPARPRIKLRRGRVAVHVPPMPTGGRLVVETSDAEVIVHGTRFIVDRRESEDATLVTVQEGLVEVRPLGGRRSAVFVRPGEQVAVPSSASYFRQLGAQVGELIEAGRCDDQASSIVSAYLETAEPTIDVSAALYLVGSCAEARGDVASALSSFERVAASSGSPLRAENALARSAQLRAAANPVDGVGAWRRYLDRFPLGQHRETAQRYLRENLVPRTPN
jgi:ferric-dicitrate binding protein FerR (iron transport regulator)